MTTTDSVDNVISQNKLLVNAPGLHLRFVSPQFDLIFVAHKLHEFADSFDQGGSPCDIVAINRSKIVLKSPPFYRNDF